METSHEKALRAMDDAGNGDDSTAITVMGLFAGTAMGTIGCFVVGGIGWGLRAASQWSAVCGLCGCGLGLLLGATIGVGRNRANAMAHDKPFSTEVFLTIATALGNIVSALGAWPIHLWPVARESTEDDETNEPSDQELA